MSDIPSLRKSQIEKGQLPSSTIPIPITQKSPDDYKDDINANRNSIIDGLVNNGFTSQFVKDLLDKLSPEEIHLASMNLPQIISRFSKMDKSRVRVNDVVRYIILFDEDTLSYGPSVFTSRPAQKKPAEPVYSHPDETDKIVLESAICLAKWQENIASIDPVTYPKPYVLQENWSIRSNKQHPLYGYSDDFIDQLRKKRYVYENFVYLLPLSKLPKDKLRENYNKIIQLRTALSNFSGDFSISQKEWIKNLMKENGGRVRDAQNAYIASINNATNGIFEPGNIARDVFSSPSGWGFKSLGQQTYSGQDMPYGNWRENIAELVLERIDCFIDFFKKLDPTLLGGNKKKKNKKQKTDKKQKTNKKRKTNKKQKTKRVKTVKRRR